MQQSDQTTPHWQQPRQTAHWSEDADGSDDHARADQLREVREDVVAAQ